jgi:oligosaccharyltransferase complex subunit delta (ribophorin II)
LTSNAADFRHQSGAYEMTLLIGDALLQNGCAWKLNDQLQLSFHDESLPEKDHRTLYEPKKEIIHQFRPDEKRPPTMVSLIFSGLTLFPLVILLLSVSDDRSIKNSFL